MRSRVDPVTSLWIFFAFLVVVGATTLVVGAHDAALSRAAIGVSIASAVLLAVGVVLLLGALDLTRLSRRDQWPDGVRPPCRAIVLVAFLLAALLGVSIFFSAARTASAQRPIVVAFAILTVAFALAGLRFFGREARVTLPRVGTILLGFVGTLLGAWQFWYSNQYVPSKAGRAVELKVTLAREAHAGWDAVHASIDYETVGRTSVSVIGSAFTLTGANVFACTNEPTAKAVSHVFGGFLTDPQRTRFASGLKERQPADVLAAGKFVGDGKRLDPGVAATREYVFLVPHGRYELLRLRAQLFAINGAVELSQRAKPTYAFLPDHNLYAFWHIDDDSWLHDLVYGRERWVVARYELVNPTKKHPVPERAAPDLRVTARFPDPTWHTGPPADDVARNLFAHPEPSDSSEPFADAELADRALAAPAGKRPKCG